MKSMTGFGRSEHATPRRQVTVEIKSYNSRYLEVSVSAPPTLGSLEPKLRERYDEGFESFEVLYGFARQYADDVVELLGDKVDELEKKVQEAVPEVKHIDVEPD